MGRRSHSTAKMVGYAETAEPLIQAFIAQTPAVVEQMQAQLPRGFSQQVADKVLSGLLSAARTLERMSPD